MNTKNKLAALLVVVVAMLVSSLEVGAAVQGFVIPPGCTVWTQTEARAVSMPLAAAPSAVTAPALSAGSTYTWQNQASAPSYMVPPVPDQQVTMYRQPVPENGWGWENDWISVRYDSHYYPYSSWMFQPYYRLDTYHGQMSGMRNTWWTYTGQDRFDRRPHHSGPFQPISFRPTARADQPVTPYRPQGHWGGGQRPPQHSGGGSGGWGGGGGGGHQTPRPQPSPPRGGGGRPNR